MRVAILDHRYGEQIPARGVLHQDERVRQLERPRQDLHDLGCRQLMGDRAVAKAIQPKLQVFQLQHLAVGDGDEMDGREIWVLGARAETGELGEALVEDLAVPFRGRPDLPGRGISRRRDRFAAVLSPLFVHHPTPDFASGTGPPDSVQASCAATATLRISPPSSRYVPPMAATPSATRSSGSRWDTRSAKGYLPDSISARPATKWGVSAPQTATRVICLWTMCRNGLRTTSP